MKATMQKQIRVTFTGTIEKGTQHMVATNHDGKSYQSSDNHECQTTEEWKENWVRKICKSYPDHDVFTCAGTSKFEQVQQAAEAAAGETVEAPAEPTPEEAPELQQPERNEQQEDAKLHNYKLKKGELRKCVREEMLDYEIEAMEYLIDVYNYLPVEEWFANCKIQTITGIGSNKTNLGRFVGKKADDKSSRIEIYTDRIMNLNYYYTYSRSRVHLMATRRQEIELDKKLHKTLVCIHEMTHAVQYYGGTVQTKVDTTYNEIEYLKLADPASYLKLIPSQVRPKLAVGFKLSLKGKETVEYVVRHFWDNKQHVWMYHTSPDIEIRRKVRLKKGDAVTESELMSQIDKFYVSEGDRNRRIKKRGTKTGF
jgi:hypothetical protein